ncbi:MAG: DNA gyrase inhibitor YacG, partial [Planctomycetales bacterium]|nr:DNA gyrase inhibitor YacG [Planctomycetales bacterium]
TESVRGGACVGSAWWVETRRVTKFEESLYSNATRRRLSAGILAAIAPFTTVHFCDKIATVPRPVLMTNLRTMPTTRCPICRVSFDIAKSDAMPFCSTRCKQIDLGRWLNEDYSVPHVPSEEEQARIEAELLTDPANGWEPETN